MMRLGSAFAYWSDEDPSPVLGTQEQWRTAFADFRIIGDRDVEPILDELVPGFADTYRRIRIPAARSDIARLAWLHRHGGFYLDCHVGLRDEADARRLHAGLAEVEHIFALCAKALLSCGNPFPEVVLNLVLLARPGSSLVLSLLRQTAANLCRQREAEIRGEQAPYNIWSMGGPGLITATIMTEQGRGGRLRPEFEGRVRLIREEDLPATRNANRTYHDRPHWSVRQKTEPLFEP